MATLMTLFVDKTMTARWQTHREQGMSLCDLGCPEISEYGDYGKEVVRIPKTNTCFFQFLPWAHPHADAMLRLTAKEWE